jgi:hypothetical protein
MKGKDMTKLTGSVGKMGPNKTCDVAVVQAALMNAKGGPFWPGPVDGKKSTKFVESITSFQSTNGVRPVNGTFQSGSMGLGKLRNALRMPFNRMQGIPGTAIVCVPPSTPKHCTLTRYAEKSSPLPKKEAEGLVKIVKKLEELGGGCLSLLSEDVDFHGYFTLELSFADMQFLDNRTGKPMPRGEFPITAKTELFKLTVGTGSLWTDGGTKTLTLKSRLRLETLEKSSPASTERLKAMGIEQPENPIAQKLVAAAIYILDHNLLNKEPGKSELPIIYEALARYDVELKLDLQIRLIACNDLLVETLNNQQELIDFDRFYENQVAEMLLFAAKADETFERELIESIKAAGAGFVAAVTANPLGEAAAVVDLAASLNEAWKQLTKKESGVLQFRDGLKRITEEFERIAKDGRLIAKRRQALWCQN